MPFTVLIPKKSCCHAKCRQQPIIYWIDAVFGDDVIYQLLDVGK